MDLFMIRLENGNSVVVQAENEVQALEFAGLRSDPREIAKELTLRTGEEHDPADIHFSMVSNGVGPQNFTIRKLANFICEFHLQDGGEFESHLSGSDETCDEFYVDYPELNSALDEWSGPILTKPEEAISTFADPELMSEVEDHAQHRDKVIAEAVARERTRLIAKV